MLSQQNSTDDVSKLHVSLNYYSSSIKLCCIQHNMDIFGPAHHHMLYGAMWGWHDQSEVYWELRNGSILLEFCVLSLETDQWPKHEAMMRRRYPPFPQFSPGTDRSLQTVLHLGGNDDQHAFGRYTISASEIFSLESWMVDHQYAQSENVQQIPAIWVQKKRASIHWLHSDGG